LWTGKWFEEIQWESLEMKENPKIAVSNSTICGTWYMIKVIIALVFVVIGVHKVVFLFPYVDSSPRLYSTFCASYTINFHNPLSVEIYNKIFQAR
jgi:hypothetical protein